MSTNNAINIEADIQEVSKALDGTAKSLKSIRKQVLGSAAKGVVKTIKSVIQTGLKKHTGFMYSVYKYKVAKDGSHVSIFPRPKQKSTDTTKKQKASAKNLAVAITSTLNYGNTISAKKAKFLFFSDTNGFVKTKSVRIPGVGFLEAGWNYAGSDRYESEMNKIVEKELKKYWG